MPVENRATLKVGSLPRVGSPDSRVSIQASPSCLTEYAPVANFDEDFRSSITRSLAVPKVELYRNAEP